MITAFLFGVIVGVVGTFGLSAVCALIMAKVFFK